MGKPLHNIQFYGIYMCRSSRRSSRSTSRRAVAGEEAGVQWQAQKQELQNALKQQMEEVKRRKEDEIRKKKE